jgi:hypothetical protein
MGGYLKWRDFGMDFHPAMSSLFVIIISRRDGESVHYRSFPLTLVHGENGVSNFYLVIQLYCNSEAMRKQDL